MLKTKFFATLLIVLAVLFAQVGSALAAPQAQESTPITGTIQTITVKPGVFGGEPVVVVTVLDDLGETQTVNLSVEAAAGLGLLLVDPATGEPALDPVTGLPTADPAMLEQPIEVDPMLVIPDEEPFNPVAGLLAEFFGTTNADINQMHEAGFGFGVIAQALWIARDAEGNTNAALATDILLAKQNKDFETFFTDHPEYVEELGGNPPTNWGQFKKTLRDKHENLGSIVSGHADNTEETTTQQHGNGNGNGRGNGNGNGNGNGHGNGNGNGNNRP